MAAKESDVQCEEVYNEEDLMTASKIIFKYRERNCSSYEKDKDKCLKGMFPCCECTEDDSKEDE